MSKIDPAKYVKSLKGFRMQTVQRHFSQLGIDVPALRELVTNASLAKPVTSAVGRVGRNAPCPCGSGHKHKYCCLPIHLGRRKVE